MHWVNRKRQGGPVAVGVSYCLQLALLLLLSAGLVLGVQAATLNVNVVDGDGNPVSGFRWLVEHDNTHTVQPGVHTADILSLDFHKSHAPVIASGESTASNASITVGDNDRYFVSVMPFAGFTMSGGGAEVGTGNANVTVVVNELPLPTATISILAFEDMVPINNKIDLPEEQGVSGLTVVLEDAAGIYGIAGGQVLEDIFGNPLGTTYLRNPDFTPVLDGDGNPIIDQLGSGVILTNANGRAIIRNLAPAKYGVQLVPPPGSGWIQTSTLEGGKTIDAWVKANEPTYFQEFGAPKSSCGHGIRQGIY